MAEETPKAGAWVHRDTGSVICLRPVAGGRGFHVRLHAGHLPRGHDELRETWHGDVEAALIRVAHLKEAVVPGDWAPAPRSERAAAAQPDGPEDEPGGWEELRLQAGQAARAMSAMLAGGQLDAEARLSERGIRPVSVIHGDPESEADADLIGELHRLAGQAGPTAGYHGGGDYVTFLFSGPDAGAAAAAFAAGALAIARPWWRITPTARPAWGRP